MASPKGAPVQVEPREPTAAQPAGNEMAQDKAEQMAQAISESVAKVGSEMQRVVEALAQMGIPEEQLQPVVQSVQAFAGSVQELLGGGGSEQPEQNQTVDAMGGDKGVPA